MKKSPLRLQIERGFFYAMNKIGDKNQAEKKAPVCTGAFFNLLKIDYFFLETVFSAAWVNC